MPDKIKNCSDGANSVDAKTVGIWIGCSCIRAKSEYSDFIMAEKVWTFCLYSEMRAGTAAVNGGCPVQLQAVTGLIADEKRGIDT